MESIIEITGTLIWYYYICHREVWLMARKIEPDQGDSNIQIGRFIQEQTYLRDKKEISLGNIKLDIIRVKDGQVVVVGEVKKSSKFKKIATMQLAFYLLELKSAGINAVGELMFPTEKKKILVELNDELIADLVKAKEDILRIIYLETPPQPIKINFCKSCAYSELCWA